MFHELGLFLRRRLKSLQTPPHEDLQEELDVLLMQLEQLAQRDEALLLPLFHLFSIRLYLFPQLSWPVATPRQAERLQQHRYRLQA